VLQFNGRTKKMKYFVSRLMAALALRGFPVKRSLVSHQYSIFITLCAFAMIIGFILAAVIQLFSNMFIFPVAGLLCGSLLSISSLGFARISWLATGTRRNPHDITGLDLLERSTVSLEITAEIMASLKGKVILVTGAAGSIGSELCRQLLDCEPLLLIALDTNETGLFDLVEGLRSRFHPHLASLQPFIGDITDRKRMAWLFAEKRPNIIFHAAAFKHVPLLEQFPDLAVRINTIATYHLCCLAQEYATGCFVFISTDKAAEPVSIMGASKRFAEIIVQAMGQLPDTTTRFCAVRFGNVIGSRGSVVPVFAQQIERGGPLTVTDAQATRYFMTISEACGLVLLVSTMTGQGGLYLLDMGNPVYIIDLAVKMIRLCGLRVGRDIPIIFTGLRPGERLHETLTATDEELTPTGYNKIFSLTQRSKVPGIETVVQWIDSLEESLQQDEISKLRARLFGIVGAQRIVVAS
jgi:FlaA1/EpsC-like NDP-sugar epimerase